MQREAGDSGLTLEDVLSVSPMEETVVEHLALKQALSQLPDRERRVIVLRYYHELTQERTAKLLGVSQVQISRIERKALQLLRTLL